MSAPPAYTDNPNPAGPLPPKVKGYGATPSGDNSPASEPLLGGTSTSQGHAQGRSNPSPAAWMDTDGTSSEDDDGYKVGINVIDCDAEIRLSFIRKVYSILFVQLLLTAVVATLLSTTKAKEFTRDNGWIMWIPLVGSIASLFFVYWKRHQSPANLILLGIFTIFESMMIGLVTSYVDSTIVLQALFITLGVFTGLTLFTFQTKFDFSSFAPFLFAGIWGLITASLVQIFIPFSANLDLGIAYFSVLLFSGFVLYDTQQIMKRLSVDEYILASLSLYLDFLNLFLSILRVLNNQNNR